MAQSSPRHFQLWLFFFSRNGIFMLVRLSIFISLLSLDMVTNTIPFIWFFTYQVFLESGGRLQFIKEGLHLIQCKAHACCCLERAGIHYKDDTLPCKCQALAWKNEPKAWIQGFQALKIFFGCIVFLLLYIS